MYLKDEGKWGELLCHREHLNFLLSRHLTVVGKVECLFCCIYCLMDSLFVGFSVSIKGDVTDCLLKKLRQQSDTSCPNRQIEVNLPRSQFCIKHSINRALGARLSPLFYLFVSRAWRGNLNIVIIWTRGLERFKWVREWNRTSKNSMCFGRKEVASPNSALFFSVSHIDGCCGSGWARHWGSSIWCCWSSWPDVCLSASHLIILRFHNACMQKTKKISQVHML